MLTLQFIPYSTVAHLDSEHRVRRLLEIVKDDKIILLEGRLEEKEEVELIKKTMESISEKFTGIELGVIHSDKKHSLTSKLHKTIVRLLLGNRGGFTIIGPANIVKEIKKDPDKIQLLTKEGKIEHKKKK